MKNPQKGFIVPLLLIIVAILLAGGGAYFYTQNKSENPPAVGNVTLPQATSTIPEVVKKEDTKNSQITIDQIKNMDVPYAEGATIVTLSNGKYFKSTGPSSGMYLALSQQPSGVGYAYGDVNGDGASDLVAIFNSQNGGTGFFGSLYVFINKDGKPQYITLESIGDRAIPQSISIVNGVINLDMLVQGPGDSAANPTMRESIKYKLVGTKLSFP